MLYSTLSSEIMTRTHVWAYGANDTDHVPEKRNGTIIMSMQPPEDNSESLSSPASGTPSRPLGRSGNTNWGRRTGALGRGVPAEPPDLRRYPPTPRYDMATIADLVGVRAVTLWSWEQNLGIIIHDPAAEAATGLRYSERDLIILIWLREQIVAGADPLAAAQCIREAITATGGIPPVMPATPRTPSRPLGSLTGRLGEPNRDLSPPTGARFMDPTLNPPSQPISRLVESPPSMPLPRPMDPSMNPPSMPLPRMRSANDPPSQPISRLGASRHTPESVIATPMSRPVHEGGQAVSQTWVGAMPTRDLRGMVKPLLDAFATLNMSTAARILDDAFLSRSVETTCMTLISPTLSRINEMWVRRDETLAEGLFGLNVLKARLFRLFDVLPENSHAPLTFIAAGPGESHEIEALMLALFWRRIGVRVVYFGQGVTGHGIVSSARKQRPRVVALTVSTSARARLIGQVATEFSRFDTPRPNFCLVGDILARNGALRKKTGGIFLGADAGEATQQVRQMLRATAAQR